MSNYGKINQEHSCQVVFLCDLWFSHVDWLTFCLQIRISSQQFDGYTTRPGQLLPNDDVQQNDVSGQNSMDTEQANDDGVVSDTTMETSKVDGLANGTNGDSAIENGSTGNEDNEANKDSGPVEEPMLEDNSTKNDDDNEADKDDGNIVPQESKSDGTTTMDE